MFYMWFKWGFMFWDGIFNGIKIIMRDIYVVLILLLYFFYNFEVMGSFFWILGEVWVDKDMWSYGVEVFVMGFYWYIVF